MINQDLELEILPLFKSCFCQLVAKNPSIDFFQALDFTFKKHELNLSFKEDFKILKGWYDNIYELNFLKKIIQTKDHNELIVHSHHLIEVFFRGGKETIILDNLDFEDLQLSLEILVQKNNLQWNYSYPFISFTAQIERNKYRLSLIHHCSTPKGSSKLFVRKLTNESFGLETFCPDARVIQFLSTAVIEKSNLLISGSTGSGKTSFLRSLLPLTSSSEHTIIIEDTPEIMSNRTNHTHLVSENSLHKSMIDYCTYALRMSPERIIIGELRSKEVISYLLAMNTGHRGLLSTIHSNCASDALSRVALLFSLFSESPQIKYQTILKIVCKNLDYVIHLKDRKIVEIIKVLGAEDDRVLFERVSYL